MNDIEIGDIIIYKGVYNSCFDWCGEYKIINILFNHHYTTIDKLGNESILSRTSFLTIAENRIMVINSLVNDVNV
jgi:hypothetical protein